MARGDGEAGAVRRGGGFTFVSVICLLLLATQARFSTRTYVPKPRTPSASATRLRYSVSDVRGRDGGVGSSVMMAESLLNERSYLTA